MFALPSNGSPVSNDLVLSAISLALDKPLHALNLETNFIGNGGDSLSSIRLQSILRNHNIELPPRAIFETETLLLFPRLTQVKKEATESRALLEIEDNVNFYYDKIHSQSKPMGWLSTNWDGSSAEYPHKSSLKKPAMHKRYPMTEMQLCLAHSSMVNTGRNVISYVETHRRENIASLKQAWEHVLKLEPIFRISFVIDKSQGWMYEMEGETPFIWEEVDVADEDTYRKEVTCPPSGVAAWATSFKVVTRSQTGREAGDESTVIWRIHHALIDGISAGLVLSKVHSVLAGHKVQPNPSFLKFALNLQALQIRESKSANVFWSCQKKQHPSPAVKLLLPTPSNGDRNCASGLGRVWVNVAPEKVEVIAKKMGVTPASLYYTAWALVMALYTDSNSLCLGAVLSGRNLPIENVVSVVGPTLNTLPLYVSFKPSESVMDVARKTFASLLDLTTFQWSTPDHGFSRNFTSAVNVLVETPALGDPCEVDSGVVSDFAIQIDIQSSGRICINYDTQLFFEEHMHRVATALCDAFDVIQEPGITVESCLDSLVRGHQLETLDRMGNWTAESTRNGFYQDSLVSLFNSTAEENSAASAVDHCSRVLTYAQLHEQSNKVGQHLAMHIGPGSVVCVHADGTPEWIVAIYAVLKAGAIYCPLDPAQPDSVRARNFTVAGAKMFLAGSTEAKTANPASCELCLSVEELLLLESIPLTLASTRMPRPDSTAYICLTSGSTGTPKAVQCRHAGLVAFQKPLEVRLFARPGWRIAQFMSPAFDGSIHEIFSALSYGATLVLKDNARPFEHLHRSDVAIFTPSIAKAFKPKDFPALKALYLVGEAVPQGVCDTWASELRLFNMYGPTEVTCGATIKPLRAGEPVTIGGPNSSTRVYILDSQQRLAPWGAIGEIYLAGVQVAAGYVGKPEETANRFLPDKINAQFSGESMYKTGDRAYWDEHGDLIYLGRLDREIKLRGFRINLDDLETQLRVVDEQCTAAAVVREDDHLIAIVQPADLDTEKFAARLRLHIPVEMRPRHILAVESFPVNKIGKLDYAAITTTPLPASARPKNLLSSISERKVAGAIRDMLGLPVDSNIDGGARLSDLGVRSIEALSLAHKLSQILHHRIPPQVILGSATVRDLACELTKWPMSNELLTGNTLGEHGVSPVEMEWWSKYQQRGGTSSFNVSYACSFDKSLDMERLIMAWNMTLERHDILRSRYRLSKTNDLVRTYAKHSPVVTLVDDMDVSLETNVPFDLASDDNIIRVLVSPTHLLVVISHIVCDLTTLQTLLSEVAEFYKCKEILPARKTYAQTTWSQPAPPRYLSFWDDYLLGAPHYPLSLGCSDTPRKTWEGASHISQVSQRIYEAMLRFTSEKKITMHQLVLASVALALQHGDTECDITLGAPYLNRDSQDDLEVVGLFLQPLPIRIRYPVPQVPQSLASLRLVSSGQESFIRAVQQTSTVALSHAVPWDQLISQRVDGVANELDNPLFDAMVTFHDVGQEVNLPLAGVCFMPTSAAGSKFKLMVEFTARRNFRLMLRLEYSVECFEEEDMVMLERLILEALMGLVADEDYYFIARRLDSLRGSKTVI